jgi:type II secretory pathway pseudopilin PulG
MSMVKKRVKCGGFIVAELLTATALLGLLIAGLAISMSGFSMFNRYQWSRQRCVAAAQAQLDSIVARGRPIESQELERLWPHVEVSVDTRPGEAPWDGLELVQVTAVGRPAGSRPVTVHLARYVLMDH